MSTVTEVNPRLKALTEAGVSVWLDQIRRSLVQGGELARMVAEESLRGVTANPSIFEKAILGSTDYDEDLVAMAREKLDARTVVDEPLGALGSYGEDRLFAYLRNGEESDERIDAAIEQIAAATTFGYGPRFLHSTGQLHKGGPSTGRFLQLVADPQRDVEIPGAGYSFGTLIAAQAAGDLATLRAHGLAAERVKLEGEPVEEVRALTERVTALFQGS